MPATYDRIATTTLGSANATITFSSIPATYTDLKIVFTGTATASGDDLLLRLNGDTGTNYSVTALQGNGATASSFRSTSIAYVFLAGSASMSTTIPTFSEVDIFSYAGGTNKTLLAQYSGDFNGSGVTARSVGLWRNTAAITSVSLLLLATTFKVNTTATLYGILKA
jgi:hypothetical protein